MVQNLKFRLVFILIMLALAAGVLIKPITEGESPFNLGLDLRGGVTLRYLLPDLADASEDEARMVQATSIDIFTNRLDSTGIKELSIRPVGIDQVEVAIPGIQSNEADDYKAVLSSVGRLEFRLRAETQEGLDLDAERTPLDALLEKLNADGVTVTPDFNLDELTDDLKFEGEGVYFRWCPVGAKFAPDWAERVAVVYDPNVVLWELVRFDEDPDKSITGEQIESVQPSTDQRTGLPAVGFNVKPGKDASNMGDFTGSNINKSLTILLDGQIQSIATINGRISDSGIITGGSQGFSQDELRRLIAVIRSGSLPVKPILESEIEVGPSLGEAAIDRGYKAGVLALALVLVFLVIYYRTSGFIACLALGVNMLLLMGVLSFLDATLTMPGIAGLVLTIGMAVDANILIFERIREEHDKGKTLAQAVKSGFDKAFFTIVDANVTTFLTAFFLFKFGTGPIRGFAAILMIGLATSMFSSLYFSKSIFALLIERRVQKLPMMRLLSEPKFQFLSKHRIAMLGSSILIVLGLGLFFSQGSAKYGMDFTGGYEVQLQFREARAQAEVLGSVQEQYPSAEVVSVGETVDGKAWRFQVKLKTVLAEAAGDGGEQISESERFAIQLQGLFGGALVEEPIQGVVLSEATEDGKADIACELHYAADVKKADLTQALQILGATVEGPETGRAFSFQGQFVSAPASEQDARARISRYARELPAADGTGALVRFSEPVPSKSFVGPRVGVQLRDAAIRAILFSLIGIILYIRIRFKQYRYGFAACLALVHDVLITLGALAFIRMTGLVEIEIDLAIIAAFLTIIGYSLNDTIVIFDRVRENLPRSKTSLEETLDRSINQTLSRTILTSMTTLISVLILFAFNLGQRNVLEGFAFSLIVGVIVGTYSTMFVASPAIVWLTRRIEAKKDKADATPAKGAGSKGSRGIATSR